MYEGGRDNITGILLVKKLIKYDPEDSVVLRDVEGASIRPPSCSTDTPLFDVLNMFQTGKSELDHTHSLVTTPTIVLLL